MINLAGHSTLHPYLKSYDELLRTMNRIKNYANMYRDTISNKEKYEIQEMIEAIETAIEKIPQQYHISRWNQFKNK
jgi:oligoendopeptidase F